MPPFIIFAAKQINPLWTQLLCHAMLLVGLPRNFFHWLEHFIQNAVAYRPILLLIDDIVLILS